MAKVHHSVKPSSTGSNTHSSRIKALARPEFFTQTGRTESHIFGIFPTGHDSRHHLAATLKPLRFSCTCRLRTQPCQHIQAMLLFFEMQPDAFPETPLPNWATQILEGEKAVSINTGLSSEQSEAQKVQRKNERLERAANGLEDMEIWLEDLMRRGLATTASEDPRFYNTIAARMADASLSGLARTLRLIGEIPVSAPDWAGRVLAILADIYLAINSFKKRAQLPDTLLADLQGFLGINFKKEEVLTHGEQMRDNWAVLGREEEQVESQLYVRRQWLLGASGRYALLLDFAFGGADFPPGFQPGDIVSGSLAFYPSGFPQRALSVSELQILPKKVGKIPGLSSLRDFQTAWSSALAAQPWLESFPFVLQEATPVYHNNRHWISDTSQNIIPLSERTDANWRLLAASQGRPLSLFGIWNGSVFRPLSALSLHGLLAF